MMESLRKEVLDVLKKYKKYTKKSKKQKITYPVYHGYVSKGAK